jgi:surface carbohydrate biosynthesis protein
VSSKVNVLFPVEAIDRELDFRLRLAGECAGPGNRIVIAQHDVLHEFVPHLKGGVYVGKNVFASLFPTDLGRYHMLRERGVVLVHLDEEGLVEDGSDQTVWREGLARRLDSSCLQPGDHVCAWGTFQRDFYRSRAPSIADDIVATGHPRFDLCKPAHRDLVAEQVRELRRRHGRFVLVNTSFGLGNSCFGVDEPFSVRVGYSPEPAVRDHFFRNWLHESHLVSYFAGLIYRLSLQLPHETFVIRPHPVEDRRIWDVAFRDSPNVHVVREGSIAQWLLACDVALHERCTTGIEAALAGAPIVTYMPLADERRAMYLPSLFGVKAETEDDAVAAVQEALSVARQELEPDDVPALGRSLLANLEHDAFAAVAAVIAEAEAAQSTRLGEFDERALGRIVRRRQVVSAAKRPVRPLFPGKAREYADATRLFYGFSAAAVRKKLEPVERATGKRLRFKVYGDTAIVIESAP